MTPALPYSVIAHTDVIGGYTEEFCVACRGQHGAGPWKYQDNLSFTQREDEAISCPWWIKEGKKVFCEPGDDGETYILYKE